MPVNDPAYESNKNNSTYITCAGHSCYRAFAIYKIQNKHIEDKKDLEGFIDKQAVKYIADSNAYGLVIGIYKNGKVLIKGYGTTGNGKNEAPDSSTTFELASTSKLFTTSTLQLLVDKGELNMDDKIQTLLGDKVQLPAIARHTTLQNLATHLSGFPSLPESFLAKMTDESDPYKDLTIADMYDYLKTCEGKKAEGTFEYSNFGMGLLGHLLELKTGIAYEQLVKQRLLNELGMYNTFVTVDSNTHTNIIQGYDENGKPSPIWTDHVLTGAGSFLSNGDDMIRFIKANLRENETPISPSLFKTHIRQLNGENGLGWILPTAVDKLVGNKDVIWHNGMAGAYASFLAIDKTNNSGIIILSNKAIDVTGLGMKLMVMTRTQSWKE
ncbi:MAG: serine hydrolase domain-containing protein [Bacteroidota bacterium]